MFKSTKLLKVVSIIMIVFGAIGGITSLFTRGMIKSLGNMPGMDTEALLAQLTPMSIVLAVVFSIVMVICGVLGVMGKGYKIALGGIIIILLYQLYSAVTSVMSIGFSFATVTGFILPILYLWGLYQSKE
ncbi:MAG: hypothetical protein RSD97_03025 [Lachnospiraceae bacterium]